MEKIRFQKNSDEMMCVISEQKKSLYLKAYVGSVYKDGVWRKMPEGQDPLQWFLTTSRTGNQMLYASAAVEAFRAHGIPARYVEVYFDGVGWKAVDVTPGYYYNVATLQKMVNTPEQIKKNAAMILLGAVTVLVIAGFILFVILEIRLWLLEQTLKKQYEQADMDQKITDCFETIESGNYERACGLMEKTIYGEIELELFEERTVRSFRDKLAEEAKGLTWKEKLKLRYQFQKYCM